MLSQDLRSNLTSCSLDEDDSFRTKPHEKKNLKKKLWSNNIRSLISLFKAMLLVKNEEGVALSNFGESVFS